MLRRWLKRIPAIAIASVLIGMIVYAFIPHPVGVDMQLIQRGPMLVTVDEDGRTRIKEKYVVSSPLSGRLTRIELKAGHPVIAGNTVLAMIEPSDPALLDARSRAEFEARAKAAQASVKRAEPVLQSAIASKQLAESELGRVRRLFERNNASKQEMENAEMIYRTRSEDLRAAQFSEEISKFELEQARAALTHSKPVNSGSVDDWRYEVRSPINGKVLRVFQESATIVSPGARIMEIGDPSQLEVEIDVLSSDGVKIQSGAKVLLEHWGGERPLAGTVRLVEPSAFTKISALGVEEQRVFVIVDFTDPPDERMTLGDGFRVEAKITVWESASTIKVPTTALFRRKENWAVFVVENNRAKLREIKVGRQNSFEAQVLEGLQENESVIVHPSDSVKDGAEVFARDSKG